MQFEFSWIKPSLVICRMSGAVKADDFVALTEAIVSNPKYRPGMDRVIDLCEIDATSISATDIERIADRVAVYANAIKTGRLALVVGSRSPLKYGLARMFEAFFGTQVNAPVAVFETVDAALAWLDATDSRISLDPEDDAEGTVPAGEDPRALSNSTD